MKLNNNVVRSWCRQYNKLAAFTSQYGHPNVPSDWKDKTLAQWVQNQRKAKHKLPAEFRKKLTELNFDFSTDGRSWESYFSELQEFAKRFGHPYVPASDPRYSDLHNWLVAQVKNKEFLHESRVRKLDYLGVRWEMRDARAWKWQEMYLELKAFKEKYGHANVPQKWSGNRRLSNWVLVQRRSYSEGKMETDRKKKLDQLGFVWDFREVYASQWEEKYSELRSFRKRNGHCKVPLNYKKNALGGWVDRQRTLYSKGKLSRERIKKLNEIGFIWDCSPLQEQAWREKYKELIDYKKKRGDCFVPANWKENRALGIWVSSQRALEKKGKLPADKKKALNKLGFIWSDQTSDMQQQKLDEQWEHNYRKLVEYYRKYGVLQVSVSKNRALQRWTCAQRKNYQEGILDRKKFEKLDRLGFPWDIHSAYWIEKFEELKAYKKKYGHTRVPWRWKENPQLGQWVSRTRLRKYPLTQGQIRLLNSIGFDWKTARKTVTPWHEMYERLVDFKQTFGHTRVPVNWEPNKKLGKWISRIRSEKNKLHPKRKEMLESIDFDWSKRRGRINRENWFTANRNRA